MASYSEEFLNALSRTASSFDSLADTLKEPDWKEKAEFESDLQIERMIEQSGLNKGEAEFQEELNRDSAIIANELAKDLGEFQHENTMDLEALKAVYNLQLAKTQAEIQMGLLRAETFEKYKDAGYDVGDVDFSTVAQPSKSMLGYLPWEGWLPDLGLFGSVKKAEDMSGIEGRDNFVQAKSDYKNVMALYNMNLPNALRAATVDPNSASVQEAIRDADQGIEQAYNLLDWAEWQGLDDDAAYYSQSISQLERNKALLQGNKE